MTPTASIAPVLYFFGYVVLAIGISSYVAFRHGNLEGAMVLILELIAGAMIMSYQGAREGARPASVAQVQSARDHLYFPAQKAAFDNCLRVATHGAAPTRGVVQRCVDAATSREH